MQIPRNTGIEVSDAKRLNTCFDELVMRLVADPDIRAPYWIVTPHRPLLKGKSEIARDFNRTILMKELTTIILREQISDGSLVLWVHTPAGEERVDRFSFGEINQVTLAAGLQVNSENGSSRLGDMPLWVKRRDWAKVLREARWKGRFGTADIARRPGRPNQSDEAIELHVQRVKESINSTNWRAEAKAIHAVLAERHRRDPGFTLKVPSIEKALREWRKQQADKSPKS